MVSFYTYEANYQINLQLVLTQFNKDINDLMSLYKTTDKLRPPSIFQRVATMQQQWKTHTVNSSNLGNTPIEKSKVVPRFKQS